VASMTSLVMKSLQMEKSVMKITFHVNLEYVQVQQIRADNVMRILNVMTLYRSVRIMSASIQRSLMVEIALGAKNA